MQKTYLKVFLKIQSMKNAMVRDESGQDLYRIRAGGCVDRTGGHGRYDVGSLVPQHPAFTNIGTKLTTYTS